MKETLKSVSISILAIAIILTNLNAYRQSKRVSERFNDVQKSLSQKKNIDPSCSITFGHVYGCAKGSVETALERVAAKEICSEKVGVYHKETKKITVTSYSWSHKEENDDFVDVEKIYCKVGHDDYEWSGNEFVIGEKTL